jgi:hypothetical protein
MSEQHETTADHPGVFDDQPVIATEEKSQPALQQGELWTMELGGIVVYEIRQVRSDFDPETVDGFHRLAAILKYKEAELEDEQV